MYHCHIQIYLLGGLRDMWEQIKAAPTPEQFTYTFVESVRPEAGLLAQSDVIFADLHDMDAAQVLPVLTAGKRPEAELVVLAGGVQAEALAGAGEALTDLWIVPMSLAEVRFRFGRWQQTYKLDKDRWQAEYFLDTSLECSPNLFWIKDGNGIYRKVNHRFCEVMGKTTEEIEGKMLAHLLDAEEEVRACIESEQDVMRRRETCGFDEAIQIGNGVVNLSVHKSPLYDLDGSVMGTLGVAVDMTQKLAFEHEVAEKSRTLEMLFSSIDCGMMYHSVDGAQVISINNAALRLLGYESQEELEQAGFRSVAQSVVEEDRPKLCECIASLTKPGDSADVEYRVQHKDGKLLYILGNVKLVEKDGELFYQRFLVDVTAQKLHDEEKWAEKDRQIRYQEQMFEIFSTFLSNNVDDVYMMMNGSGSVIEFVTPNIERVLGVSAEAVLNDASAIGQAEYITGCEVGNTDLEALEPGMALESMETKRVNPTTGEEKWFRESVYCVSVQGLKKIVVYISDRTRERKSQNELSEALEMAQVANKAKSVFLSNVSHDIRTPMNAIMGFVALLREEANSPECVLEYTQKISAASLHLLGLISDVLDLSRMESGSAMLNISELNLAELMNEVKAIIRPQARAKKQSFELFSSGLTHENVQGDKLRINQILINILSNAVKYTQTGGKIKMWVTELPQLDKDYARIRFTISDNGQGMSEEYQKGIFNPFACEQGSVWSNMQGSGLGMAITKNLVDMMNGVIRVVSELGEGSTFMVELELRIQEENANPQFWKDYNIRRILIVDDDVDICEGVVRKMADTGVDVRYANDGAQTIGMLRKAQEDDRQFDLILMDWKMPDLDGLATARLIQRNSRINIPVMLFTSYDWTDIKDAAMEVGIRNFLSKPFFLNSFKDAVQRMVDSEVKEAPAVHDEEVVKDKHVLVVDDIDVNRMILVKILSNLGAKCDTAEDGQEALEKFEASRPGEYDLILMDIQMPVLNGHEATKAIRAGKHPSARTVPIIAMTANAFIDDVRAALDAGMDAHVAKPVMVKQLESTIRDVLERRAVKKTS